MTLATCLRLLKHFESLKSDESQKESVRLQASKSYDEMLERLKARGHSLEQPKPVVKAKK